MGGCGEPMCELLWQCHMSHADISSRDAHILFKVGKTHEGYFTNTEILAQANRAMDIIDRNYPCEEHVFFYDNAKTHTARRPDALTVRNMPVNPPKNITKNLLCSIKNPDGSIDKIRMQDGHFLDGTWQSFYFSEGHR